MKKLSIIILIIFFPIVFLIGYFLLYQPKINSTIENNNNFHYLPITQKSYYDNFFYLKEDCTDNYDESIKGLIINHHLLSGQLIVQGLCQVATNKDITIILLSPNHFSHGQGHIISLMADWQTPYGILYSDKTLISNLSKNNIAAIDETPFDFEHGIYNIIPFIKKTIPHSKIIPIIVKESASPEEKNALADFLKNNLPVQSLVIASLDFSHYLSSDKADRADEQTLLVIRELDLNKLQDLNQGADSPPNNVDSKAVLEIFLNTMKQQRATDFKLIAHSNSAQLIGNDNLKETTSYIIGLFLNNNY